MIAAVFIVLWIWLFTLLCAAIGRTLRQSAHRLHLNQIRAWRRFTGESINPRHHHHHSHGVSG